MTPSQQPLTGQTPAALPASGTSKNTQADFNNAYFLSQPLELQLALNLSDANARRQELQALSDRGFLIDREIMWYGWDPFLLMYARHVYGFTWCEAMDHGGLIDLPPGFFGDGKKTYNPNPPFPPNTIAVPDPVTCDLALWYPRAVPLPAPKPAEAPPAGPYVGAAWPDMDILLGKHGVRACTPAGLKLPIGFETQETGIPMLRGLYRTFATGLAYFVEASQVSPGEKLDNA